MKCNICDQIVKVTNTAAGTYSAGNLTQHLERHHEIIANEIKAEATKPYIRSAEAKKAEYSLGAPLRVHALAFPIDEPGTAQSMATAVAAADAASAALGGTEGARMFSCRGVTTNLREYARTVPIGEPGTPQSVASAVATADAAIAALGGLGAAPRNQDFRKDLRAQCLKKRNKDGPLADLTMCCTCGDGGLAVPLARLGVSLESRSAETSSFLLVNYDDVHELVTSNMHAAVTASPPTSLVSVNAMTIALGGSGDIATTAAAVRALVQAGTALSVEVGKSCVTLARLLPRRTPITPPLLTRPPPFSFAFRFAQVF
jgi:hypothetical protein